jgi:gas vesicle protein
LATESGKQMALMKRLAKFGIGLVAGGAVGAAVGTLTAPEDGESFRSRMRRHVSEARRAGDEARATKQAELISQYRKDVGDHDALEEEVDHTLSTTDAVLAMGLGLNAPGAIASQQAALRDSDVLEGADSGAAKVRS